MTTSSLPWRLAALILYSIFLLSLGAALKSKLTPTQTQNTPAVDYVQLANQVTPPDGVLLPLAWGDLGQKLITSGVINQQAFLQLFKDNLADSDKALITGTHNGLLKITPQNSQLLLDLLWGLGLGNKNPILDSGPINQDPRRTGNMASTGGWDSLSVGHAINHFSRHPFVTLTPSQQALVEEVSQKIFRFCCPNSTYFPDCNHGMAMLGALELGAAQGLSRDQLFKMALTLNSYWFRQNNLELAAYFQENDIPWDQVKPEEVLGANYSSNIGYAEILPKIKSQPSTRQGGGGCSA